MYTLGIETSCDETSCAVLRNYRVLSNITLSSLREHKKYGGVVPEIATRAHLDNIDKAFGAACGKAKITPKKIDLIAVTQKPGLIGALVVGLNFAKALALGLGRPFIGVDHLKAHLFSVFLNNSKRIKFPFLGVVISGGHSEIYRVDDFNKIKLIGHTLDDACGEVYDKIAVNYKLGYPGGPLIDKLFNPVYAKEFAFKCGRKGLNLSFSGIKTALIYKRKEIEAKGLLDSRMKKKLVSSFQYRAIEAIIEVILEAIKQTGINRVVCGGGVIANSYLRRRLKEQAKANFELYLSPPEYAGDNAAMVAGLGFYLYNKKGISSSLGLPALAN